MLLAIQCFVYDGAADGYGVSPIDSNGFAYLLATGMRDFSLGLITLFLLLKFRQALPVYFLLLAFVPVADTLIVIRYGTSILSLAPHLIGLIGLLVISFFAFQESKVNVNG